MSQVGLQPVVDGDLRPATLDRALALEVVRITERAAIAAAAWRGKGDERRADLAAVAAMEDEMRIVNVDARVVIGEMNGDLVYGAKLGTGKGPKIDLAVDPLEGSTGCAKNQPDAMSVMAVSSEGGLMHVPECYMEKIAIGPGYPQGIVDLDRSPSDNIAALAEAKGVPVSEIVACVLDRPRHSALIAELRGLGVAVKLLADGDIAAVIHTVNTDETGIDIYLGSGGASEGVLAAAAMRCMDGQMQGRLILDTSDKRARARDMGIIDPDEKFGFERMASGDVLFAATGVTQGSLLDGVRRTPKSIVTSSVVMRSWSHTSRWIRTEHRR